MMGAVAGGLMENLSLVVGLRALLLIAALFYLVAGLGLRGTSRSGAVSSSTELPGTTLL
jgi:hypothetical protein